ncbi:hypothetical protein V1509DRAFT_670246, partial [Lipomyces kononenkoae]
YGVDVNGCADLHFHPFHPFGHISGVDRHTDHDRNEFYADIKINETLCERYENHIRAYGKNVLKTHPQVLTASSDIGNVSYAVPTLHAMFGIPTDEGTFLHDPTFAEAAGTDSAFDDALIVGKTLALVGWDVITDDGMYQVAKSQWQET